MKKLVICYRLSGHDNDSYMLGEETRPAATDEEKEFFDWRFVQGSKQHPATCQKCGRKTDPRFVDPKFELRKRALDISSTYDGYTIVSERFKSFCEGLALSGVEFIHLPSQATHYWLVVHNILVVDKVHSAGIRFLYYCDRCNCYAGVFGADCLRFTRISSPIASGIYRTDIEFAQAHEQHPVLIVSTEVGAAIKAKKLKGVCLNEVEYI